jgi:hypothetical protein
MSYPIDHFQVVEIESERDLPFDIALRVFDGELDSARKRFVEKHGFECHVAYKLRGRWWMVMDPEYRIEVE